VLLLALLPTLACGQDAGAGLQPPVFDPRACAHTVVPHRIGFAWEALNHRISEYAALMEPPEACLPTHVDSRIVGGEFTTGDSVFGISDDALLRFSAREIEAAPEQIGVHRVRVEARMGPEPTFCDRLELDREAIRLQGYPHVEVFVAGFDLSTREPGLPGQEATGYDPALGWTVRGLGARAALDPTSLDGPTLALDWCLRFEPGLAKDRLNLNQALPLARWRGGLDLLVVGVATPDHARRADVGYTLTYPMPEPLQDQEIPPATPAQQALDLPGPPGMGAGLVGFAAFDFLLDPDPACEWDEDCPLGATCDLDDTVCRSPLGPPGYYVRELTAGIRLGALDPTTGTLAVAVDGYASNATRFLEFYALRHTFQATVVRVALPADTPVTDRVLDRAFPAGAARFALDGSDAEPTPPADPEGTP
jgi:hypothetical protein